MINSISFKANYLTTVNIKKKRKEDSYRNCRANIVELSKKNYDDKMALAKIAYDWEHTASGFSYEIYNEILKPKNYPDIKQEHYYALTTQKRRFDKLEPDKILGVALFSEKNNNENELNYLQVKPSENFEYKGLRTYKKIGSAILKFLKSGFSKKPISVESDCRAVDFYQKNDFKNKDGSNKYQLIWNSNK